MCYLVRSCSPRFEVELDDAGVLLASANTEKPNVWCGKTSNERRIKFGNFTRICRKTQLHVHRTLSLQSSVYPRQTQLTTGTESPE